MAPLRLFALAQYRPSANNYKTAVDRESSREQRSS